MEGKTGLSRRNLRQVANAGSKHAEPGYGNQTKILKMQSHNASHRTSMYYTAVTLIVSCMIAQGDVMLFGKSSRAEIWVEEHGKFFS